MPIHEHPADGRWSIALPNLALTWQTTAAGHLELTSLQTAGDEWLSGPVPVFDTPFTDVAVVANDTSLVMTGTLGPDRLTARIAWTLYPDTSVVRSETTITNATDAPVEIGAIPSLRLLTTTEPGTQLAMLAGGRWDESMPPRGYRYTTYDLDEYSRSRTKDVADDGRSSGEWIPWFALTRPESGLFAGLVWSGRWHLQTGRSADGVALDVGLADFAHTLAPGASIELPQVVLSGYAGDLDDGADQWRHWIANSWTPPVPENWPWVQYNHWYAYYGDIDQERLFAEAELAAAAGCEVFVIDDGWFVGRRKDSYHAGWGNWTEDRSKFPDGLKAFGDRIRALGMKFGLWVEPERAAIDSPILQAHPDWATLRDGATVSRPEADKGSVHLCLGNPDVQEWMARDITRVVQDYGVDWLKWDYNIGYGLGCNATNHGHQAGDGHYAHTAGLYRMFATLRQNCPDLMIENCASGGHRVDLGTLRYTHTNWVSDYTNRAASCRQHTQGAGLFMPLAHLNTWVLETRDQTEFRSRMGGAFGVSWFLAEWTPGERAELKDAITEYKRLRPLLSGPRALLTGPWHQDWDIWQYESENGEAAAILAFREHGQTEEVRIIPRIAHLDRMYRVALGDGSDAFEIEGFELAGNGLSLMIQEPVGSEILWLTAIG
jgi:alpha-galactosidase